MVRMTGGTVSQRWMLYDAGHTPATSERRANLRPHSFKVAVIQSAPVVFNRRETLAKVKALTGDASALGAKIVLFPEAFVSGYPRGLDFGAVVGARSDQGRKDYQRYWESSVDIPGAASDELGRIAQSNQVFLVIGVIEREGGTLYCLSLIHI